MDGLEHPPSAHRIWQEPNIPALCQDFKGIEPPGFPQLINKQELWSQLTDLLLGEKRNQRCFLTSSLSVVPGAASAVLTGAASALPSSVHPIHLCLRWEGTLRLQDKNCTSAVILLAVLILIRKNQKWETFLFQNSPKTIGTPFEYFLIVYLESWLS